MSPLRCRVEDDLVKLGDITSSEKTQKSSKDNFAASLGTQDSDYIIKKAGWDIIVAII